METKMNEKLKQIISTVNYVDFNAEYEALGIDLDDVRDKKTGKVIVADDVQAVVVAKKIIKNIENSEYLVARNNYEILFYNSRLWVIVDNDDWFDFLHQCAIKMKIDFSLFSTVKFQKMLRQTMLLQLSKFEISI